MVHDVISATKEVAGSVSSCGNFCSPIQNIVTTRTAQFPDAGKFMAHLPYASSISKCIFALLNISLFFGLLMFSYILF
jgi:hypothetical protein